MSDATTTNVVDLPPHTWRQWWRQLPGYWRVGAWAVLAVAGLHFAVILRIVIGLQEHPRLVQLRQSGTNIVYPWTYDYERYQGRNLLMAGLFGRSPRNVVRVYVEGRFTERDFEFLGRSCPNLRYLSFRKCWTGESVAGGVADAEVTTKGLAALRVCRRLEHLDFEFLDIDDEGIQQLIGLSELTYLTLRGTLVTNKSIPYLAQFPKLNQVDCNFTEIDFEPLENEADQRLKKALGMRPQESVEKKKLYSYLRWADREIGFEFPQLCDLAVEGPPDEHGSPRRFDYQQVPFSFTHIPVFSRRYAWGDGDYRFTLKVGQYEAEPVIIRYQQDVPATHRVEFRMPVTKAVALAERGRQPLECGVSGDSTHIQGTHVPRSGVPLD